MGSRYVLVSLFLIVLMVILLSCGGRDQEEKASKEALMELHYQRGMEDFFEKGRWMEAFDALSQIEKMEPGYDRPYFHYVLGFAERRWHNYPKAVEHFEKEYEAWDAFRSREFPQKADLLWFIGDAYLEEGILFKGFFNTAVNVENNYYSYLLFLNKRRREGFTTDTGKLTIRPYREDYVRYFRGLCRFYTGQMERAISDLKSITPDSELYARAQNRLAALRYREGKRKAAEGIWRNLIRQSAEDPHLLSEIGASYIRAGGELAKQGFELCERSYQRTQAEEDVGNASGDVGGNFARALLEKGEPEQAKEIIERIDLKTPLFSHTWGVLEMPDGTSVEYRTHFYDPIVLDVAADIYLTLAKSYFRRVVEMGKDRDFLIYVGLADLMTGDFQEAIKIFREVRGRRKDKGDDLELVALLGSGVGYHKLRDDKEAETYWRIIEERFSEEDLHRSSLGYVFAKLGINGQKALSLCQGAGTRAPGPLSKNLGYVFFSAGIQKSQMDLLTRAIELYEKNNMQESQYSVRKNDPMLLQSLSDVYYNKNLFDYPPKVYLQFRAMYPASEQIFTCLQRTREIWEVVKWAKYGVRTEWFEISKHPDFWYDRSLKRVMDRYIYEQL